VARVLADVSRSPDVLHEVQAVALERAADAPQDPERLGLIVDRIERRHEVELIRGRRRVEVAQVADDELGVRELSRRRFRARERDPLGREVHAREPAPGVARGDVVEDAPTAAAHVEHPDARGQAIGQTGHQRHDVALEARGHRLAAVLGHHGVEALVALVGDAAAAP
jgi:hypothetical protein